MSHEINELAPGVHSFAGREDAWHRLGTVLGENMDAQKALETAHLAGWNVRKIGLNAPKDTDGTALDLAVPDRYATVYTNPVTGKVQYLGTVGKVYTPIQNEEKVDLLNAVVDESGAHFVTAGSIKGGRETFVTMELPKDIMIGGIDPVNLNLVAINSHDGMSSFRFLITPIRVVCANTAIAAVNAAQAQFSIRHTANAQKAIAAAREALGITFKYVEEFEAEAEKMIQSTITDRKFENIIDRVFKTEKAKTDRQQKIAAEHRTSILDLWKGESQTIDGLEKTKWGAYNAITEYTDHYMGVRGGDSKDTARAQRAVLSRQMYALKSDAFALLQKA